MIYGNKDAWKKWQPDKEVCAHRNCPKCKGTGRDKTGRICIHHISCRCRMCNPIWMSTGPMPWKKIFA